MRIRDQPFGSAGLLTALRRRSPKDGQLALAARIWHSNLRGEYPLID
jgi:hypothetical protein